MRHALPTTYIETKHACPPKVMDYLMKTGWYYTVTASGDYYFTNNRTGSGYFTWEQAVAYNLVSPFLE